MLCGRGAALFAQRIVPLSIAVGAAHMQFQPSSQLAHRTGIARQWMLTAIPHLACPVRQLRCPD
jgi:hypothetical protein